MKAALFGFEKQGAEYAEALMRCGCSSVEVDYIVDDVRLVLMANAQSLDEVIAHLQSLRHVFILEHDFSAKELKILRKVAQEAAVLMQFSAISLYEWNIPNLKTLLNDVRLVQVYKDYIQSKHISYEDMQDELLAAVCLIDVHVNKVVKSRSVVPCDFEVMGFSVDFINAATAHCWIGSGAFAPRHELRFYASNGMAMIDMLQKSIILKTRNNAIFTSVIIPPKEAQEKEVEDFVQNVLHTGQSLVNESKMMILKEIQEQLT